MTAPDVELRRAWQRISGGGHDAVIDELIARHAEPHRRYHTATHVMWVLRLVDDLLATESAGLDADAIRAAALFHDVVHDPRSSFNEVDSGAIAARHLEEIGWDASRVSEVRRLIEATATHRAIDAAEAVLLDADLAVLGADPAAYAAYATGVREEYSHVDDAGWRSGRGVLLRGLLDRERIYATEAMHDRREHRARANITAELRALDAQ
jgi:predicted metal-dependent HD superfamily phosphohydrolase